MDFILSYADYNKPSWNKPEFMWNESQKCLKVGSFYLFLEHEIILTEQDEKLNELFGFEWADLIPHTTSDWVHLGVDGVSAITSAIGGKFAGITVIIDILHAISYFIEAQYNKENAFQLRLCGLITAMFAPIPAFGSESVASSILKRIIMGLKSVKGSNIFKAIINVIGLGTPWLLSKIFKFLFNIKFVKTNIIEFVLKYEDNWVFKALSKIPGISQMIDFIKKDLSVVLDDMQKYIIKDFDIFKKATLSEAENQLAKSYKTLLDDSTRAFITEKQFLAIGKKSVRDKVSKLTADSIAKNGNNLLKATGAKNIGEAIAQDSIKAIRKDSAIMAEGLLREINAVGANKVSKYIQKEATDKVIKYYSEHGIKNIPYDEIVKSTLKKLPAELLTRIPVSLAKRLGVNVVKNAINNNDTLNKEKHNNTDTVVAEPEAEHELQPSPDNEKEATAKLEDLTDRFGLSVNEVSDADQISNLYLVFHTPDKQGEDAKLTINGEMFNEFDLTSTLGLYNESELELLLDDLKLVGIKSEDKNRLRDGEKKKWEKSSIRSTPWINKSKCRFDFYFLIRERSKISFFKKQHEEVIDWSFLNNVSDKAGLKLNGSLYLIVKKVPQS